MREEKLENNISSTDLLAKKILMQSKTAASPASGMSETSLRDVGPEEYIARI